MGSTVGLIKGDIRSLGSSSYEVLNTIDFMVLYEQDHVVSGLDKSET